jgi:ABC-type oligopeptide transport system ATPase subunit
MQESEQLVQSRSESSVLEFRNVSQYFNDKNGGIVTAAEDINLSIKYGEVMALVGESG